MIVSYLLFSEKAFSKSWFTPSRFLSSEASWVNWCIQRHARDQIQVLGDLCRTQGTGAG